MNEEKNIQNFDTNNSSIVKPEKVASNFSNSFFKFIDKYKYAPLGTAFGTGLAVFSAGAIICQMVGIKGSVTVALVLALISLAIFALVHSALLYRSRALLQSMTQPAEIFETRRELNQLLPKLDQNTGEAIQRIVVQYENQIRDLQDKFSRLKRIEIPGKPIIIEAGHFLMGSNDGESDEIPAHKVAVSAFFIDKYPVTNKQFAEFINDPANEKWRRKAIYERYGVPYYLPLWDGLVPPSGTWDHPVVNVNWFACVAFCNWRSTLEGKQEIYTFINDFEVESDFSKNGWRLQTEAEWEMAARGGYDNLRYPWEGQLTPTLANYGRHYRGTTPVGQFSANKFGVFDMLGNVKEWCHDCYSEKIYEERSKNDVKNPVLSDKTPFRCFRGGSWMDQPEWIHLSKRGRIYAQNMNPDFGFRCVRRP